MSIKALNWAWEQHTASSGQKLVLLALADHANDDGHCWPGMGRIAEKCGMSARQVSNHVSALEACGLLEKTRRMRDDQKYSTYLYHLKFSSSGSPLPVGQQKPISGGPAEAHFRTEPSVENRKKEPSLSSSSDDDGFAEFWKIYPRKVGKGAALKAFRKHRKKTALDLILNACSLYAIERKGKDVEYTAHPATWLNQERWHDDQDPAHNPDHQEPEIEIPRWEPCGDCNNGWITEYDDKGYEYARPCICRP